jgi:predicted dehydrogenase
MICDASERQLSAARRRFPVIRCTASYNEMCESSDVDLIAIATPISTHYELAKRALLNGKDVFVEKPLCTTSSDAEDLLRIAKQTGRRVFVDHTFVYNPAVRTMKDLIRRDDFGKPLYYDSVRGNLGLFQADFNVLWDLAPHDLSILDYVLEGAVPESVTCVGSAHFEGTENIAYVSLVYSGGFIAHFHLNWLAPVKIRQILFGGSKKMLAYDDVNPTEKIRLYDKGVNLAVEQLGSKDAQRVQYRVGDVYAPFVANTESLKIEVDHIVSCYFDGATPMTGIEAGVNVVRILEAADRSMRNGGQPINIVHQTSLTLERSLAQ